MFEILNWKLKNKIILSLFMLLGPIACQTASTPTTSTEALPLPIDTGLASPNTSAPAGLPSDPWFGSARQGDWTKFELLQKSLNRPWDFQAPNGVTALMVAARHGQIEFVEKLLSQKKVSVNRSDDKKYNALSYAMHGSTSLEVRSNMCILLVKKGADPFAEDHLKLSSILVMIEWGFFECIKEIKLTDFKPCDQADRLSEVTSLTKYAELEEEFEIRDYFKAKGCK
jgi:hypothetical protein